jgi:ABC-type Fe3+/spermidine/putrescine transport system ATPase subunit
MQLELKRIQHEVGITFVHVTHDQEEAMTMADRVVVMRGGKLEQVGTPKEVYDSPVSRFVASFIGVSNFIPGTVSARDSTGVKLNLSCGTEAIVPDDDASDGERLLSIRPESINLRVAGGNESPGLNEVIATVEHVVFKGQTTHVHMKMRDGSTLLSNQTGTEASRLIPLLVAGADVIASWSPDRARIVLDS